MNTFSIITILVVLFVIFMLLKTVNSKGDVSPIQQFNEEDFIKKNNDKVIRVKGPIFNDVKNHCKAFCDQFNEQKFQVIINLTRLDAQTNLLTFPYDIDMKHFCYLINYLHHVKEWNSNVQVTGWHSCKEKDSWAIDPLYHKQLMISLPQKETHTDYVYAVSEDKLGYKLLFNFDKETIPLDRPPFEFEKCCENLEDYSFGKGIIVS